jgi:iron complex outermembrane receptor protein
MKSPLFNAIIASSLTFPIQAQIADDIESITVLGKVAIANATHGGVDVKMLPINIHVVSRKEIERIRFVDPNELLDRIPGETQVRNLRIPNGSKGYTIVMIDGMPIENPYQGATSRLARLNTADIERVEIFKGPASALYGNNAFGGVVNVVTRSAPSESEHQLHIETGEFNRSRLGFNSGGMIGDVGYFFDANHRKLDGLRQETKDEKDQISTKLSYDISDSTSLFARIEYLDEYVVNRGDLTALQIEQDKQQAGSLSSSEKVKQSLIVIGATHQLEDSTLTLSFANRLKKAKGLSRYSGPKEGRARGIMAKITYHQPLTNGHFVVGSENYNGNESVKAFGRKDITMVGEPNLHTNEFDDLALFYQHHWQLSNKLSVDGGARFEHIALAATTYKNGPRTQKAEFEDISPKLGLTYQVSASNRLWVGLSQGFYAPRISDMYSTEPEASNPNLKPEQAGNIEFGLRGTWGEVSYDTSIYHNKISNYLVEQEFVRDDDTEYQRTTNAGQVTISGIESVVEYSPFEDWRFSMTHTYTDNSYDSFVQSTIGASDDLSGKVLRRSPKHHYNARIAWVPLSGLSVELEGDYYSTYFSDNQNSPESEFKRDERLNLRVSYDYQQWRFWLNGLNLTDTLEDRATYSRGKMKFRTIDGRTVYAGLSYNF